MFGKKADEHITMLQRVVALVRDIIIGLTALQGALLAALGGAPSDLTPYDWLKLLGSSFLVVAIPLASYYLILVALSAVVRAHAETIYTEGNLPFPKHWKFLISSRAAARSNYREVAKAARRKLLPDHVVEKTAFAPILRLFEDNMRQPFIRFKRVLRIALRFQLYPAIALAALGVIVAYGVYMSVFRNYLPYF